jgi:hypothetical protein
MWEIFDFKVISAINKRKIQNINFAEDIAILQAPQLS